MARQITQTIKKDHLNCVQKGVSIILLFVLLVGCEGKYTDSGVIQETQKKSFVGAYEGTFELKAIADVYGDNQKILYGSAMATIQVTDFGTVVFMVQETKLNGVIDDSGKWEIEFGVNDFGSMINQQNKDILKAAGCPFKKQFAKLQGLAKPPDILGELNGKLSCKVLLITVGYLEVSGNFVATK